MVNTLNTRLSLVRKLSRKFSTARLAPPEEHLEGAWTLVSTNNYDKFLAAVGAGPLSSNMVLRARINLGIKQVIIIIIIIITVIIINFGIKQVSGMS